MGPRLPTGNPGCATAHHTYLVLKERNILKINEHRLFCINNVKPKLFQPLTRLELLEAGARDPSDFTTWQNKMRKQDMDAELAEIERRRLEGKLSHEEAILARQNLITVRTKHGNGNLAEK